MERKPPSSIGDFLAVIRRRKYWLFVPAVLVAGVGIGLSPLVPRSYMSTATVEVVPPKVSAMYVKPSGSEVMNRLRRINIQVTSGVGFQAIIEKLNLYPELRKKDNPSQLVALMRKNVTIALAPDSSDGKGGVGAFTISYVGATPKQTRDATNAIANLFVVENAKEGHIQAQGTDAFLNTQVTQVAQRLAEQRAKIQAFKNAHLASLPEQAQANMAAIAQYQAELQANRAAIDQDNQQRVYLRSVLNVNPSSASNSANAVTPPAPTPLQIELAQKKTELNADLMKYTPQHPDVILLQHDIARLEFQIRHAPKATATNAVPVSLPPTGPTTEDQLRGQLAGWNADVQTRTAHAQQIEQKIAQLQGTISTVPAVQTEFAALDSDYQELQKTYDVLLQRQQEASMAAQLDQRDDSEQFMLLEPANLPAKPYRPDPILLDLGAVFIGVFVGFLCALLVELRDDTLHNADEAASYLKLPVMVALPKCQPFSAEPWPAGTSKR